MPRIYHPKFPGPDLARIRTATIHVSRRIYLPLAGIALAACLVAVGAHVADWPRIGHALAGADKGLVALAVPFLVGTFLVFSVRWGRMLALENPPPSMELFRFLMIGYFANAILPARPGDVVRAVLLRQSAGIGMSTGLASIVLERIVDLTAVCCLGLVLSFFMPLPATILTAVYAVSGGMVALLGALAAIRHQREALQVFAGRHPRLFGHALIRRAFEWLGRFLAGISIAASPRRLLASIVLTALGWILLTGFMASLLAAFRMPVPWSAALLVLIATNLGALMPLSPGAIGVYHFMAVVALAYWKVDTSAAIAFAIGSHAVAIGLHVILGMACAWLQGMRVASIVRLSRTDAD